jgi:ABC-2 type transport system permease protein
VIGVFGRLTWWSLRNRIMRQLRQLRSPRYLAALVLGATYLYAVAMQQRPVSAPVNPANVRWLELLGALAVLGAVAWGWIFGVERRVLAFTPAEVTFLFSAPVSRRELIQYKLLRNQLLILFNALLWTLILSHERFGASPWLRAISIWVLLTTLSFHRLGASFVRTSLLEHGRSGLRHRVVSIALLVAVLTGLIGSVAAAMPQLSRAWGEGVGSFLVALGEAAEHPVPATLLYPFALMVRPLGAHTAVEWLRAISPAVAILLLHYIWVIRSDTAFEEAAAEASLRRARAREARGPERRRVPRAVSHPLPSWLRLAPVGWPGSAILWKNLVAVARTRRVRNVGLALASAGVIAAVLSFAERGTIAEIAGWLAATWAGIMLLVGPQWVRNDLRGDLLRIDLLRSYPLPGSAVVTSEAAGSALVLTLLQLGLLMVAYLAFLGNEGMTPGLGERSILLGASLIYLPAVNFVGMLIQNGGAILFPAWVHLGGGRPGGVEVLGQNMLMIMAFVAVLALTLAIPAAIGGGAFLLLRPALGWWSAAPATALLLGALAVEAAWIVDWLGKVFERTDPVGAGILV